MRGARNSVHIAVIAYRIWEQEGRPEGRAMEHWQLAEKQLEIEFRVGFPDATDDAQESSDPSSLDA